MLALDAFREVYSETRLTDEALVAILSQEMAEVPGELGDAFAGVGTAPERSPLLVAMYAGYPAREKTARRQASLFHLTSRMPPEAVPPFFAYLRGHAKALPPVPPDSYYLARFAVVPELRGKGTAELMLRDFMRRSGFATFSLHVRADNSRAISFYRKCGFASSREDGGSHIAMVLATS